MKYRLFCQVVVIHCLATWFMTGLIWFVQIVHYPLFAAVGEQSFSSYEKLHANWTTWVVAPAMLVELLVSGLLLFLADNGLLRSLSITGFVLLLIVWLSTWLIQVPCHDALSQSSNEVFHRRLVNSNWLRTIAWTVRGVIAAESVLLLLRRAQPDCLKPACQ